MATSIVYCAILSSIIFADFCSANPPDNRQLNPDLTRSANITPCDQSTWGYSNITGSCYMFPTDPDTVTWNDGIAACNAMTTASSGPTRMLIVEDAEEQRFIDDQLLRYNYEDHWINAHRVGNTYQWNHDGSEVTYTARWDTGEPVHECVYLHRPNSLTYEWVWRTAACSTPKAVYCQQKARQCPPIPMADFLQPSFSKPHVEQTITFTCKPGYQMPDYKARYEKWQTDKAANLTNDTEPYWKENPSLTMHCNYSAMWDNTTMAVAPCEPLSCEAVPVVNHATANDSKTRVYPTWTEFKCDHGYYYKDINSRDKVGWCGPDVRWHDVPRECDPVPCQPFTKPENTTSNNDHNTFYSDIIAYRCLTGYMFPPPLGGVWRFVYCGKNFVNELIGRWNETDLPGCEKLRCPPPPTGPNVLQYGNGTEHLTRINYTCVDQYEFPDSSTSMIVECSDDAIWKPKLPNCNKKPVPLPITGKKYQPPTVDAPGASSIGSTAMIVCIIMFAIIVLLDLTTISKDFKMLKSNLKHFKRRLTGSKQHTN